VILPTVIRLEADLFRALFVAGGNPDLVNRGLAKFIVRLPAQDPAPDDVSLSPATAKVFREADKIMKEKVSIFAHSPCDDTD
jgi:hypothetical protein